MESIPTTAYHVIEEIDSGKATEVRKSFAHVPSPIGALEANEVGMFI